MFLLVPAYPGSPGQKAVKRLCVCVCVWVLYDRNCKQCLGDIVKSAGYLHSLLPRHLVNTFVRYSSVGGVRRL